MADPLSPVSPISPTPSMRRSTSTSDTIETLTPTQQGPIKTLAAKAREKELPPDYNEATPPPSYPASTRSVHDVETTAPEVRKRWMRRHPWWCSLLSIVLLAGIICAGVFGALCSSPDSGCGPDVSYNDGSEYPDRIKPTYSISTISPTSTHVPPTMATETRPRPTGFAEGKRERLVYENIGGKRPIVGSSMAAVSIVDLDGNVFDQADVACERVFYHDTQGQIYESYAVRKVYWRPDQKRNITFPWSVYKIPGAVMAVNTSMAVVAVQEEGRYNTTALFFTVDDEVDAPGRIARVLSRKPGEYEEEARTPYNPMIEHREWRPLAATQVNTLSGPRVILAFVNQTRSFYSESDSHYGDLTFVNGMWDVEKNWTLIDAQEPLRLATANDIQKFFVDSAWRNAITKGSVLAMQKATTATGEEGFVMVSREDMDEPYSGYAGSEYGNPSLATVYRFYKPSPYRGETLWIDSSDQKQEHRWSTLAMWSQFDDHRDQLAREIKGGFSEWSSGLQCNRTLYLITGAQYGKAISHVDMQDGVAGSPVELDGFGNGPVAATDEHVLFVVMGNKENAKVVEYAADEKSNGRDGLLRQVGNVTLFEGSD